MTTIPDDIWKAARALRSAVNWQSNASVEVIARALLAERERAAGICDQWLAGFGDMEIRHTSAREYAVGAVQDIAAAIRGGEA